MKTINENELRVWYELAEHIDRGYIPSEAEIMLLRLLDEKYLYCYDREDKTAQNQFTAQWRPF